MYLIARLRQNLPGLALCGVLATGLSGVGIVCAQAPPPVTPEAPLKKIFTNKTEFHLPIKIEEGVRSQLREICLYVKAGGGEWQRSDVAPPTQSLFKYRVVQDGEYGFSVVTVDRTGGTQPTDLPRMAPGLVVVVDTTPPAVDLQPFTAGPDQGIQCMLLDANPDFSTLKVSYRAADQTWHPLELVPGQESAFRVVDPEVFHSVVRITAADRAGNAITKDVNLRDLGWNAVVKQAPMPAAPITPPTFLPPPPAGIPTAPITPPQAVANPAGPVAPPQAVANPAAPVTPPQAVANPAVPLPSAPGVELPVHRVASPPPASIDPTRPTGNRQIINCTRAAIDYKVDQTPSGVSRVDVYLTSDGGLNWRKLTEDADRRSPAEIDLPGEGSYGVRLAVTNGNGFGGQAPKQGETPMSTIEVDLTPPFVQLRDVEPLVTNGNLEIRWACSDKNLAAEPVSIYYATRREGPWTPIARQLKNDGLYKWAFSREVGGQFFVRVEAIDQAGNLTRADSTNAVVLDTTEPRAQVVNVLPIPAPSPIPAPPPQRGN